MSSNQATQYTSNITTLDGTIEAMNNFLNSLTEVDID